MVETVDLEAGFGQAAEAGGEADVLAAVSGGDEAGDGAGAAASEAEAGGAAALTEASGAPECYAEFVLPEGLVWDAERSADFVAVAKELGLSQAAAQRLVDVGAKLASDSETAISAAAAAQSAEWRRESLALYKAADIELANKTLGQFATADFKELLEATGLANSPAMIGVFKAIGEAIAEGPFVEGDAVAEREKSLAERIYGR